MRGKTPTNHTYIHVKAKQFVVEGKGKKKKTNNIHKIVIHCIVLVLGCSVMSDSVQPHGL